MKTSTWWTIGAVLSIIGGIVALAYPGAATLLAEQIAGFVFVFAGLMQLFSVGSYPTTGGKIWAVLWGLVQLLIGGDLLAHPLEGIVTLTLVVGLLVMFSAISRFILAFALPGPARTMVFVSGAVSALLAFLILYHFPSSATFVLGTFLAIELLSSGFGQWFVARHLKQIEPAS